MSDRIWLNVWQRVAARLLRRIWRWVERRLDERELRRIRREKA